MARLKSSYNAINANRRKALDNAEAQRNSEIARMANDLQKQGTTRTEAVLHLEKVVPRT